MEVLCIIPARGGSQRLPGKNLASINGKPMIAWTIAAAQNTKQITRMIVSTDDDEISRVAAQLGAEIILRPDDISGPHASTEMAIIHVLDSLLETEGYKPDIVVLLQVTSPIRKRNDISDAIKQFIEEDADSLLSVCATHGFLWKVEDGLAAPITFELGNRPRSQDVKDKFVTENGSIYVFKPQLIIDNNSRLGGKIVAYYQSALYSVDIDYPEDLHMVDVLFKENTQ